MFLKSTNLPTIDKYPYSFDDLRKENPNTCFNVLFFDIATDEELKDYNVYRIVDAPLEMSTDIIISSKSVVYDSELSYFYFRYEIRDKTKEELRLEKYNPITFLENLADNLLFQQWSNSCFINPSFSFMMVAFQNNKYDRVQNYYDYLKSNFPLPDNAQTEWQQIAEDNGIDLTF